MTIKQKTSAVLILAFLISFIQFSCSTTKKSAISCPDITVKKSQYKVKHNRPAVYIAAKNRFRPERSSWRREKINTSYSIPPAQSIIKEDFSKALIASTENISYPLVKGSVSGQELSENKLAGVDIVHVYMDQGCDTIFLRTGSVFIGKVEEITQSEIKYRRCNNLTGPLISISKTQVVSITYMNGTKDLFGPSDTYFTNEGVNQSIYQQNKVYDTPLPIVKTEGLGLSGFIASFVGLFVAGIPLGILAVVFGIISLSKIGRNPMRLKGRGFAITAIILGSIDIIGAIIYLSTYL